MVKGCNDDPTREWKDDLFVVIADELRGALSMVTPEVNERGVTHSPLGIVSVYDTCFQ